MDHQVNLTQVLSRVNPEIVFADYADPVSRDWNYELTPEVNILYYMESGDGQIWINGRALSPAPEQILLIPKGARLKLSTDTAQPYHIYWCHFHAAFDGGDLFEYLSLPAWVSAKGVPGVLKRFQTLTRRSIPGSYSDFFEKKACLCDLLATYISLCPETEIRQRPFRYDDKVQQVIQYIQQHLNQSLPVKELAGMVYVHPAHLFRLFKSQTGMTPLEFIHRAKLDRAKEDLLYTSKSIGQIAADVGMEPLYFSSIFKKYFGAPPSVFRKTNGQK